MIQRTSRLGRHGVRAKRDLAKLQQEDAEAERQRIEARRAETLANKRALGELRLQGERDSKRREREFLEAEQARRLMEFERRWRQCATDRPIDWLALEQRQAVLRIVEEHQCSRSR